MKSQLKIFIISVFALLLAAPIIAQINTGSLTLKRDDCVPDGEGYWSYSHLLNVSPNTPIKINYTKNTYDYFMIYTYDNGVYKYSVCAEEPINGEQSVTIISSTGTIYVSCEYGWNEMNNDTIFSLNYSIDPNYTISTNPSVIQGNEYIGGKLGIGIQPTEKLEVNGNTTIRGNAAIGRDATISGNATIGNRLSVGSSSTSGNSIINGKLGIGTTNPTSKLHISNTTSLSEVGASIDVKKTQARTTDLSDTGLSVSYILDASSGTDELVFKGANIRTDNNLRGGGVVQYQRVLNLGSGSGTGSITTNLEIIRIETGTSTGTTTNAYGLHIVALPGINKWGIYDQSGSNWYASGKVGIGDVAPGAKLSVVGNAAIGYAGGQVAPENGMIVSGNVGIGTTSPQYLLDVKGTIHAKEIKVDLNGADYVFEKEYNLMPLPDLEKFIKEKKHLPEINPASHMQENGANLGDLNVKLLQKIEELTLYVIDQQKKIEQLEQKLDKSKN